MNLEEKLREQTYQLKNQITDLKNAFDLNRTILLLLSKENYCSDPQHGPLLQIITRLTEVNNQIMLSSMDLIQQRNSLKQEIYKLSDQLNQVHQKLTAELQGKKMVTDASEYKMMMQEQFSNLNRQLMAANEQRIIQEQEVDYWKHKSQNIQQWFSEQGKQLPHFEQQKPYLGKKKYESNHGFKYQIMNQQLKLQNKKLRLYIQELQTKLVLFIKSYNLDENLHQKQQEYPFFKSKMNQIEMFKHALNDLRIRKGSSKLFEGEIQFIHHKTQQNELLSQRSRSYTWPRHKIFKLDITMRESDQIDIQMSHFQSIVSEGKLEEERRMLQSSCDPFLVIQ